MKKILSGALLLGVVTLSAQAQISAGTKLLTGSINYGQGKSESNASGNYNQSSESKRRSFYFNPTAGYFVADNLALGVEGSLSLAKSTDNRYYGSGFGYPFSREEVESNTRELRGGLFGRYYKFVGEKVALYGQLGGGYQNNYSSNQYKNDQVHTAHYNVRGQGMYANLLPGIIFFPTDKLGLELALRGISYNRGTSKSTGKQVATGEHNDSDATYSGFNFGFGLNSLALGISLYLGRN